MKDDYGMKRIWKKAPVLMLTLLLAAALAVPAVAGSARSSLYLSYYRAWLTPESGAKVDVTIDVQAVGDMDDVGALSVEMFVSSDGGSTFERDGTYYSALFPELLDQDTCWYYDTPISHQGVAGYKYYAIITIYAGDQTGSDRREYQTYTVTARR